MENKSWTFDGIPYTHQPNGRPIFTFGNAPNATRSLAPAWLPFPGLAQSYSLSQPDDEGESVVQGSRRSSRTGTGVEWYRRHLHKDYQLLYIGRLEETAVERMAGLVRHLDTQYLKGSPDPAYSPNIVELAYKGSASAWKAEITDEIAMQTYIHGLLVGHQRVLEQLIIGRHFNLDSKVLTDEDAGHLLEVIHVQGDTNSSKSHPTVARTMNYPRTTPATDIVVRVANGTSAMNTQDGYKVPNAVFRQRLFQNLWIMEVKRVLNIDDPPGLVAYPWRSCQYQLPFITGTIQDPARVVTPLSTEAPASATSVSGDTAAFQAHMAVARKLDRAKKHGVSVARHFADSDGFGSAHATMLDKRHDVEQTLLTTLGLGPLPTVDTAETYPERAEITQVWTQMVLYGTYIAFMSDWLGQTRLCVRIPSRNTLLVSSPILNPLVPPGTIDVAKMTVTEQKDRSEKAMLSHLDSGKHPWVECAEVHLPQVMSGATLAALQLLCKGAGLDFDSADLFVTSDVPFCRQLVDEAEAEWLATTIAWETEKQERVQKYEEMLKQPLTTIVEDQRLPDDNDDPDSPNGQGEHPPEPRPPPSGGSGNTPSNSSLGVSGQSDSLGEWSQNLALHVAIFDGDMYRSDGVDIFHPCGTHPLVIPVEISTSTSTEPVGTRRSGSGHSFAPTSSDSTHSIFSSVGTPSSLGSSLHTNDAGAPFKGAMYNSPVRVVLLEMLADGDSMHVWRGRATLPGTARTAPIVAKLAFSAEGIGRLEHEYGVYKFLDADPSTALPVPNVYGFFQCNLDSGGNVGLLLMGLAHGQTADQVEPDELAAAIPSIRRAITALHKHGVVHGDVALRNIVIGGGKTTLLDLDQARITDSPKAQDEDWNAVEGLFM